METNKKLTVTIELDDFSQLVGLTSYLKDNNMQLVAIKQQNTIISSSGSNVSLAPQVIKSQFGRHGIKILQLLVEGKTYNEISDEVGITVDGVRFYIKKIFKALGVNNGRDAVRVYLTELQSKVEG